VTIPNATQSREEEPEPPSLARTRLGLKPSGYLVGVVGRLSPEKGHAYFIDAMAHVARSVPEVQGIIVGDGLESASLRARIKQLGLTEIVHCLGYRQDMASIYSALDLLVLPSLNEGLPNVALEAQERGCPVVGTRAGGVPEAVADGVTGLLVPPATSVPLAEAIIRLLLDTSLRSVMGQAGREFMKQQFSPKARGERLLKLYKEVLGRAPSSILPETSR